MKERSLTIDFDSICKRYGPLDAPARECLLIRPDEIQILRYKDVEGLTLIQAAERMGISKSVCGSLYKSAREKVIGAVIEGRELAIMCPSSRI